MDRVREAPVSTVMVPELATYPTVAVSAVSLLAPMVTVAPVLLVSLPDTVIELAAPPRLEALVESVPALVRPPVTASLPPCSSSKVPELVKAPPDATLSAPPSSTIELVLESAPVAVSLRTAPLSTVIVPAFASRPTLAVSAVSPCAPMVTLSPVLFVSVPVTVMVLAPPPTLELLVVSVPALVRLPVTVSVPFCSRSRVPELVSEPACTSSVPPFTAMAPELVSAPAVVRLRVAPLSTVTVPALESRPTLATSLVSLLAPMVTVPPVLLVSVPVTVMVLGPPPRFALLVVSVPLLVRLPVTVSVPFCSRSMVEELVKEPACMSSVPPSMVMAPLFVSVPAEVRFSDAPVPTVTVPELASRPMLATSLVSLLAPMVTVSPVLLVRVPVTVRVLAPPCRF